MLHEFYSVYTSLVPPDDGAQRAVGYGQSQLPPRPRAAEIAPHARPAAPKLAGEITP